MNLIEQKLSLFQLVTSKNSFKVTAKIEFEKCVNIESNEIFPKGEIDLVFDLSKKFNFLGKCSVKNIESEIPSKGMIKIDDYLFIHSQLLMTDKTGNRFGLVKEKGITEIKGKIKFKTKPQNKH